MFKNRIIIHTIIKEEKMTQKELSYLEDAIGHEKNIISIINESINMLSDDELKTFLENESEIHNNTLENLMNTLEAKANE